MPRRRKSAFNLYPRRSGAKKNFSVGCIFLLAIIGTVSLLFNKTPQIPPSLDPRVKEIGSYRINKTSRCVLLIPRHLNKLELIAIARDIHSRHPEIGFDLFDDDSQIAAYLEHKTNSLDAYIHPERMKYAYPDRYVLEHRIAIIEMVHDKTDGQFKWRLTDGLEDSLVVENPSHRIIDLE